MMQFCTKNKESFEEDKKAKEKEKLKKKKWQREDMLTRITGLKFLRSNGSIPPGSTEVPTS